MRRDEAHAAGLSVRELACRRAGHAVFSGLSFDAAPGELVQVRGANGSGKSSLLRLLCGLLTPDRGEVRWRQRPVMAGDAGHARDVAYLGHSCGMSGELTVLENLRASLRVAGASRSDAQCRDILARLQLAGREGERLRRLSQGQRQRLALARVLLSGKSLWVLDEPHAGLDADGELALAQALAGHARSGGLAVVATHRDLGGGYPGGQTLDMDGFRC
ncbi:heme ABC exporter ATP-binding protein CcmA [Ramlibacter solisilvae]|uniref:ABC transporter domain-containing protein n=1 Tax=Ramlibacter tataouinensis TaxID=94132 RepID=A0A127JYJ3_9BURK|nr:cytochrome c biogenesis heme-transporting ATPase CcmA [Ramlibacter tataouinensis]AMO25040.1 hypothetical protein UC35_22195 [Ramlibacter tataouinensis]